METYEVHDASLQSHIFDFSGIAGVADNPDFAVRVTFSRSAQQISAGEGTTGNNRFDHVALRALPLPGTDLPPEVISEVSPINVVAGGESVVIDLSTVFSDPNGRSTLEYSVGFSPATLRPEVLTLATLS